MVIANRKGWFICDVSGGKGVYQKRLVNSVHLTPSCLGVG